jgi:hypothetical protein
MSLLRRIPTFGRRALLAVIGLAVAVGIVIAFSGSLSRSTDVGAQAERARAELALIAERHAASEDELEFVQSDEFISWQARAYGMGSPNERSFQLEPGAPSPAPIVPIGPQGEGSGRLAPFDAWMELLFGDGASEA